MFEFKIFWIKVPYFLLELPIDYSFIEYEQKYSYFQKYHTAAQKVVWYRISDNATHARLAISLIYLRLIGFPCHMSEHFKDKKWKKISILNPKRTCNLGMMNMNEEKRIVQIDTKYILHQYISFPLWTRLKGQVHEPEPLCITF